MLGWNNVFSFCSYEAVPCTEVITVVGRLCLALGTENMKLL